ncbi:MAG TPA: ORF6N domain-containing protein, partial [Thermoanaerobaculia bacterium]|nr:ORF6N domain-containing protein [Thermoanaerobaculia bacterium]
MLPHLEVTNCDLKRARSGSTTCRPKAPHSGSESRRLGVLSCFWLAFFRMKRKAAIVAHEQIVKAIVIVRKKKVLLDRDLAAMYCVATRVLIQAVKRNISRFPADFMFQLTAREAQRLRSQIVISKTRGGRRTTPYAFTEEGVAMLSSVLRSRRAIAVNVEIMRAFVRLRELFNQHRDLARKISELEKRYDSKFAVVFEAIHE